MDRLLVERNLKKVSEWFDINQEVINKECKTDVLGALRTFNESLQQQQVMGVPENHLVFTYSEGFIQFGMIIFFAVSFTLAPLFSFVSNMLDIRTKMDGMLRYKRRRKAQGASGIGFWVWVMEIFAILSVPINVSIMYFTGRTWKVKNPDGSISWPVSSRFQEWITAYAPNYWNPMRTLLVAFLIEHALLVLKILVSSVIPDVPETVLDYERKKAVVHSHVKHDLRDFKHSVGPKAKEFREIMDQVENQVYE